MSGSFPSTPPPCIRGSIVLPFYHFPSRVPHSSALDFDLQLRKQLALAAFFLFFFFLRSWTCGLSWPAACPHHYWCAFIGSRALCLFSLPLLGMKDGGYLGPPSSGAFRVRAEEKLPSAHNVTDKHSSKPRHPKSMTLEFSHSFSKHSI